MTRRAAGRRPDPLVAVVVLALAAGVAMRLWVVLGPLGRLNSDEAISGLMASRIAAGDGTTFFWGQHYGGALEAYVLAAVFRVVPGDLLTLLLFPLLEAVAIAALTGVLVRRRSGSAAGWTAAAVVWVFPTAFVWFSTRPMLFYQPTTLLGLGAAYATDRILAGPHSWRWPAALGVFVGLGWWTSPQIVFFAVPCAVVLGYSLRRRPRPVAVAAAGFLVGAAPWLVANGRSGWASLDPVAGDGGGYLDHLHAQATRGLPMALGLRVPFTEAWIVPGWGAVLGPIGALVAAVAVVHAVRRRAVHPALAGALVVFPLVHALGPTSGYVGSGRYYSFLAPAIAAVTAAAVTSPRTRAVVLGAMVALSVVGFAAVRDVRVTSDDTGPLIEALEDEGVRDVYAQVWIAFKLTWESEQRITASADVFDRYPPYTRQVRAAPRAAYVFWMPYDLDAARYDRIVAGLDAAGVAFDERDVGTYRIVVPERNVPPEALPAG